MGFSFPGMLAPTSFKVDQLNEPRVSNKDYTGQQKKNLLQDPIYLLTDLGPEWCAEHDGVFNFSKKSSFSVIIY